MPCLNCENPRVWARGICRGCYDRLRRNGSMERKNQRQLGAICQEPGCEAAAFAKGFCQKHYDANRHPMKSLWSSLRFQNPGKYPQSWDRFEAFLADVGERPSHRHQLRRLDSTKPFSVENVTWLAPVSKRDYYSRDERAAYEREWRFKRKFGITVQDYERMLAEQGGGCAICKRSETFKHRKSGKLRDLAVDHDHESGIVRGLLCTDHNNGLGLFGDDPALLRAAADYIERHRRKRPQQLITHGKHPRDYAGTEVGRAFWAAEPDAGPDDRPRLICDEGEAA